jgi:hypothetical protein
MAETHKGEEDEWALNRRRARIGLSVPPIAGNFSRTIWGSAEEFGLCGGVRNAGEWVSSYLLESSQSAMMPNHAMPATPARRNP